MKAKSTIIRAHMQKEDGRLIMRDRYRRVRIIQSPVHPAMSARFPAGGRMERYFRADVYPNKKVVLHEEVFYGHGIAQGWKD